MQITVLGSGPVGRTLAGAFVGLGHDVVIGTRDPRATLAATDAESYSAWQQEHPAVRLLPFPDAGAHGEIVLNAVRGTAALDALHAVGADVLAGKVLLDLALPLDLSNGLSNGLPPTLTISTTDSLGEQVQAAFPATKVVKSLHTVFMAVMVDPGRVPGDHVLFVSGEDAAAKQVVKDLLGELGWTPERLIDLGGIATARSVEMYSALFFSLSGALGTFDLNIQVHRA